MIYSGQFKKLWLSSAIFSASLNLILPELPEYIDKLGASSMKGLVIAIFSLSAAFARPFSGKLTDKVGRKPIMLFGISVCFIAGILYPLSIGAFSLLFIRFFHGFSKGFQPTATKAFVADTIVAKNRGEALGVLAMASTSGTILGSFLSSILKNSMGMDSLFYFSSLLAAIAIFMIMSLKETLAAPHKFEFRDVLLKKNEWIEKSVLEQAVLILLSYFTLGTVIAVMPDFSSSIEVKNKGLFASICMISSYCTAYIAGKASDRFGRIPILRIALAIMSVSFILIPLSTDLLSLTAGAILYGLGFGIAKPSFYAWTLDNTSEHNRGKAVSTMYIGLELGVALGAISSSWMYNNNADNALITFFSIACLTACCCFYLFFRKRKMV